MAIDDPIEQQRKFSPSKLTTPGTDLVLLGGEISTALLGHPVAAAIAKAARLVFDIRSSLSAQQRTQETIDILWERMKTLELSMKEFVKQEAFDNFFEATFTALKQDADGFNGTKREWYIETLIGAVREGVVIPELVSYIQDLERLNEQDIIALKILNKVMNHDKVWNTRHSGLDELKRIDHLQHNRESLNVALVEGLFGTDVHTNNPFDREGAFTVCNRLQGFGLAVILEIPISIPYHDFLARPSRSGLMLLRLTGEDVKNWERWFPQEKK